MLFVRKLATAVTEELLEKTFSQFGKLERVKKLKDYAFVHFEERDAAVKVLRFVCSGGATKKKNFFFFLVGLTLLVNLQLGAAEMFFQELKLYKKMT